jgi:DMSO/TMAO reductase YedYZ molybdopterin-dependent catalytic subunit
LISGLLGGLVSIVVIALTYLGYRLDGLPFVPYDIFDWMARNLPGALINPVIASIVKVITILKIGPTASTAKLVEQGIAIVQIIIAGIILGVILGWIGLSNPRRLVRAGLIAGAILWVIFALMESSNRFPPAGPILSLIWLGIVFLGMGAVLGRLIRDLAFAPPPPQPSAASTSAMPPAQEGLSRRQFLYLVGAGSFTVLVGAAIARLAPTAAPASQASGTPPPEPLPNTGLTASGPAASPPESVLAARFPPAPGTRPELTANKDFYRIDINALPPQVDGNTWRLEVVGLVNNPLTLSLADIRSRKSVTEAVTLSCISNEIGGDLISTTLFTGVPLKDILAEAGLKPGVKEFQMRAVDDFYESIPLNEAMDERTLLVYEMNGEPLPPEHGFPLRIYIPNHYGMKQPKWLTHMEAIDTNGTGYWVERGWSETATVQTTSVVDNVAADQKDPQTGLVPVGGIAYAGARGISKVEVQVDDGAWEQAELRDPPLSPLTWVQWRHAMKASPGQHVVRVRAYDGTGALQENQDNPTFPNGATGIDSYTTLL